MDDDVKTESSGSLGGCSKSHHLRGTGATGQGPIAGRTIAQVKI